MWKLKLSPIRASDHTRKKFKPTTSHPVQRSMTVQTNDHEAAHAADKNLDREKVQLDHRVSAIRRMSKWIRGEQ